MMVSSYILGQKFYPIPYARKKLIAYLIIVVILYFIHKALMNFYPHIWFSISSATLLLGIFILFIARVEKREFQKFPLIGKFFGAIPIPPEERQPELP